MYKDYEDIKKDLTETVSYELEGREEEITDDLKYDVIWETIDAQIFRTRDIWIVIQEHTAPEDLNEDTMTEAFLALQDDIMDSLEQ